MAGVRLLFEIEIVILLYSNLMLYGVRLRLRRAIGVNVRLKIRVCSISNGEVVNKEAICSKCSLERWWGLSFETGHSQSGNTVFAPRSDNAQPSDRASPLSHG